MIFQSDEISMLSENTMDERAHIARGIFPPRRLFPCDRTHLSSIISASPTSRLCEINRISVGDAAQRSNVSRVFSCRDMPICVSPSISCASPSVKTFAFRKNRRRTRARKINNKYIKYTAEKKQSLQNLYRSMKNWQNLNK